MPDIERWWVGKRVISRYDPLKLVKLLESWELLREKKEEEEEEKNFWFKFIIKISQFGSFLWSIW